MMYMAAVSSEVGQGFVSQVCAYAGSASGANETVLRRRASQECGRHYLRLSSVFAASAAQQILQ